MQYESAHSEQSPGVTAGYTTWQHPYRNLQIHVHPKVIRSLSAQAVNSAKHEAEIGGVLWGGMGADDSLMILDATLVSSSGPLFNTSGRDMRELAQVLGGRAPRANLSAIGFFRSLIREGLRLTAEDQAVISQQLRDPDAIFMVLKPFAIGVCTAGLFFWQDGRLQTEASDLEVPFVASDEPAATKPSLTASPLESANLLNEPMRPLRERSTPPKSPDERSRLDLAAAQANHFEQRSLQNPLAAEAEEPHIVAMLRESAMRHSTSHGSSAKHDPVSTLPGEPQHHSGNPRVLLAVLLVCLVGVAAGIGIFLLWPSLRDRFAEAPLHPPSAHINLQVTRAASGQLDLNWDRNAPDVTRAAKGTLVITDGKATHKLNLDNEQLRSGKLMYFAKGDDVHFQLELNTDSMHTVAESVRVLLPEAEVHARPASKRGAAASAVTAVGSPRSTPPPPQVAGSAAGLTGTGSGLEGAQIAGARPANGIASAPGAAVTSRPNGADPSAASPERPPLSLVPSVVTATSGVPPAQVTPAGTFVPPQVVEEMMPETTPLGQFAQVSVEVAIDQAGRVTAARPMEEGGNANSQLTNVATSAAQRWRFSPATLNGKPVASQYRIVFAFHRRLR